MDAAHDRADRRLKTFREAQAALLAGKHHRRAFDGPGALLCPLGTGERLQCDLVNADDLTVARSAQRHQQRWLRFGKSFQPDMVEAKLLFDR